MHKKPRRTHYHMLTHIPGITYGHLSPRQLKEEDVERTRDSRLIAYNLDFFAPPSEDLIAGLSRMDGIREVKGGDHPNQVVIISQPLERCRRGKFNQSRSAAARFSKLIWQYTATEADLAPQPI